MVSNINHSENRTIGLPPSEVTLENADAIFKKIYPKAGSNPKCNLIQVGDRVRKVLTKNIFAKGYHSNWSDEIFTVDQVIKSMGICLFKLRNNQGEILPKKFYISELNFVSRNVREV